MARQFFKIRRGLNINNVQWIVTSGPPGGGDADLVAIGSVAVDNTSTPPRFYQKIAAGAGADKWEFKATIQDVFDVDSWRQPARSKDDQAWANLTAAETELNDTGTPGSLGGVDVNTIVDGDRILFTNISGENPNVFIVNGTPGSAATLVEDTKPNEEGDVIVIIDGTDKGRFFVFIDGVWSSEVGDQDVIDALLRAHFEFTATGVSSLTTVDTVLVDEVTAVMWKLVFENTAARQNKIFLRVDASHDGYNAGGGANATDAEYDVFSELEMGSLDEDDVDVTVTQSGSGSSQVLNLNINPSGVTVDVYGVREVVPFVANNPS